MKYKLVAMDCDGTLLTEDLKLLKKNVDVIQKLSKKGVRFIIATGRNDVSVFKYIKELGITSPVIGCNGASTRDVVNDILYSLNPIDETSLAEIWSYSKKTKKEFRFFSIDSYYCTTKRNLEELKGIFRRVDNYSFNILKPYYIDDFSMLAETKILKAIHICNDPAELVKTQKDLVHVEGIAAVRSSKNCLDIVDKDVSKGNALLKYIENENIKPAEVVAIGDSENDYSMLSKVGFSITFENGDPILKETADLITVSNNDAGLGVALEAVFGL